ncbi:MAG: autoinducer binding domain-containing protein [Gammaproteobacteria bacterium]
MIHTLIKQLFTAKSTKQINELLTSAMHLYGIKSFAFTFYTQFPTSQGIIQYSYASPPLRGWHEYYLANHFEDTDQTLQSNKRALEPIHWDVYTQAKEAKTTKENRLREESIEHGIRRGISFPIHGPNDDFASLVIHEREGETCFKGLEPHLHEIHIFGYYYYTQLKKILRREKTPEKKLALTAREYQCLRLTKENFLAEDIAALLHITPRTVHFHIQNAIKKLGVKNKYQAVGKLD